MHDIEATRLNPGDCRVNFRQFGLRKPIDPGIGPGNILGIPVRRIDQRFTQLGRLAVD